MSRFVLPPQEAAARQQHANLMALRLDVAAKLFPAVLEQALREGRAALDDLGYEKLAVEALAAADALLVAAGVARRNPAAEEPPPQRTP